MISLINTTVSSAKLQRLSLPDHPNSLAVIKHLKRFSPRPVAILIGRITSIIRRAEIIAVRI